MHVYVFYLIHVCSWCINPQLLLISSSYSSDIMNKPRSLVSHDVLCGRILGENLICKNGPLALREKITKIKVRLT